MPKNHKQVYLNNSSTTEMTPTVKNVIKAELDHFDNPSDISKQGFENSDKIIQARKTIASSLVCDPEEIYFTASGSEGDNMCIKMLALKQRELTGKNHIITSTIEHKAVLNSCKSLAKLGFNITYINPDKYGVINTEDIEKAITSNTCLISIMMVNNILGTVQPVASICKLCHMYNILFHTDMVQALGNKSIQLHKIDCDAATFSGHKIHGPKCGFVYIKKSVPFDPFINGGGQESGKRAGTENLPYIMGLAQAVKDAVENIGEKQRITRSMTEYITDEIVNNCSDFIFNGSAIYRTANNIHFCFKNISGEYLVNTLSTKYNICVSEGSACNTGDMEPDYVLKAINVPNDYINGAIRITLNENNTMAECKYFCQSLFTTLKETRGYI